MDFPGRVLVAGAGAVGSVVGGLLARAGHRVTLLGRAPHLRAIARDGLAIDGLYGKHHVGGIACVADAGELAETFDTVLLTVKSWDTHAMTASVAPRLARKGVVVSLQNGLGNLETVTPVVGADRVLGGRVIFGAVVDRPGAVRVTVHAEPTLIGAPPPGSARLGAVAATLARALTAAGVPAEPTDTITADLWSKVLYNAALNPLGALLGVPYGWLPADPDARALMDAVIAEAFATATAAGVRLRWRDAAAYADVFYERLVPATAEHRSSMLQDLERGRPTEIDAINGWVAARARALGVPAPVNTTLTHLIHARTRRSGGS